MSKLVEQTWEEWAREHYSAIGETKGALRTYKEIFAHVAGKTVSARFRRTWCNGSKQRTTSKD